MTSSAANGKDAMRTRGREEKAGPANTDTGHRLAPPTAWDLVILVIRPAFWPPAYIIALAFRTLVRAHRRTAPTDPPPRAKGLPSRRGCVIGDMGARGPRGGSWLPSSCFVRASRVLWGRSERGLHPRCLPRARRHHPASRMGVHRSLGNLPDLVPPRPVTAPPPPSFAHSMGFAWDVGRGGRWEPHAQNTDR